MSPQRIAERRAAVHLRGVVPAGSGRSMRIRTVNTGNTLLSRSVTCSEIAARATHYLQRE